MRSPAIVSSLLGLSLVACQPAAPAEDPRLDELSEQLAEANAQLQHVNERLGAIEAKLDAVAAAGSRPAPGPAPRSAPDPELAAAIDCEGDQCTLKRELLDTTLANPAQLGRSMRVVPAVRDGQTEGYKLYGIRSNTAPKLLGFENGDLVTSINGTKLDSLDTTMGVYADLREASKIEFGYERRGEAKTLTIVIE